jgi:hypothetical protein
MTASARPVHRTLTAVGGVEPTFAGSHSVPTPSTAGAGLLELACEASSGNDEQFRASRFFQWLTGRAASDGQSGVAACLRGILADLLSRQKELVNTVPYPPAVRDLVRGEFDRIERAIASGPDAYFHHDQHALRSDFRIVCFSRIPVGYVHIETSGLGRSLMLRGGVRQGLRFVRIWARTGGLSPWFQSHMSHDVSSFNFLKVVNHDAQRHVYRNVAECLKLHPDHKGIVSTSWFNDPKLETVSPHLAHLRRFPLERGAYPFRSHAPRSDHALANSVRRRKLEASGRYEPVNYSIVWPREALIAWADGSGN